MKGPADRGRSVSKCWEEWGAMGRCDLRESDRSLWDHGARVCTEGSEGVTQSLCWDDEGLKSGSHSRDGAEQHNLRNTTGLAVDTFGD